MNMYTTAVNETRSLSLPDDSLAFMDAGTVLTVIYSPSRRMINLLKGRVCFDVVENPQWPFTVRSGRSVISAVGTHFQVQNINGTLQVILIRGIIDVIGEYDNEAPRQQRLSPGQQLYLDSRHAGNWQVSSIDTDSATGWMSGMERPW